MARVDSHVVETRSVNWFKSKVDDFYENGDALYRGLSGSVYTRGQAPLRRIQRWVRLRKS